MSSSYQPFPITEFKTGLYQYLEPWIRPQDAFEPLQDAFIYRGTLNKRPGYRILGNTVAAGHGRMFYKDYLATGTASAGPYSLTTASSIVPSTLTITAGVKTVTDNGAGSLTGNGTGTVDYTTGAISVTFDAVIAATTPIYGAYANAASRPIMGLKTWISPVNGTIKLLAFDTRRASVFDDGTELFTPLNTISQVIYVGDGTATSRSLSTGWVLAPLSVSVSDGTNTIVANAAGTFLHNGNALPDGTNFDAGSNVVYATGVVTLNFVGAVATSTSITMTANIKGDYFTGDYTNFVNAVNWKPTTVSYLYCVNNVDRITLFDGTNLSRPPFPITNAHKTSFTNDITTCIDLDVFRNRLLLHRPTPVGGNPEFQTIRFSAQFNATNLVADVAGNGGALVFPTQDQIMVGEFLRDQMIVFFKNSAWIMQPTGFTNPPFRAIQVNSTRSTNCPYAAVPYDQRITSVGAKGIIACDGVNTQRFDVEIIDQFLQINPQAYNQCFSQRYDAINQTWTLYPELGHTQSNKILIYNFLENTWSVYSPSQGMSCFGLYQVISDATWVSFANPGPNPKTWEEAQFNWKYYLNQKGSAQLLAGGQEGTVFVINDENSITDNGTHYGCEILSTLWNPFVKQGVAVDFGYIDFYYSVDEQVTLILNFYFNDEDDWSVQKTITFEPSNVATSQISNFERVYINSRAQSIQMEILSDPASNGLFQIQGLILWAKPAGRLQPGYNVI